MPRPAISLETKARIARFVAYYLRQKRRLPSHAILMQEFDLGSKATACRRLREALVILAENSRISDEVAPEATAEEEHIGPGLSPAHLLVLVHSRHLWKKQIDHPTGNQTGSILGS